MPSEEVSENRVLLGAVEQFGVGSPRSAASVRRMPKPTACHVRARGSVDVPRAGPSPAVATPLRVAATTRHSSARAPSKRRRRRARPRGSTCPSWTTQDTQHGRGRVDRTLLGLIEAHLPDALRWGTSEDDHGRIPSRGTHRPVDRRTAQRAACRHEAVCRSARPVPNEPWARGRLSGIRHEGLDVSRRRAPPRSPLCSRGRRRSGRAHPRRGDGRRTSASTHPLRCRRRPPQHLLVSPRGRRGG